MSLCVQHKPDTVALAGVLWLTEGDSCVAVAASSLCRQYNLGFTTSLLRQKHIYEEISVKGEQGGSGGGEGMRERQKNVREGG